MQLGPRVWATEVLKPSILGERAKDEQDLEELIRRVLVKMDGHSLSTRPAGEDGEAARVGSVALGPGAPRNKPGRKRKVK